MQDKIPEPQHGMDQSNICICGDPNCGFSAALAPGGARDRRTDEIDQITRRMSRALDDMIVKSMAREFTLSFPGDARKVYWGNGDSANVAVDLAERTPPASYKAARKVVEQYILDINHETAWDDVIGNDAARGALIEAIEEPKLHPELYAHYGMTPPKGVMLYGPPGCGKTMFAKASAAAVGRVYGAKAEVLVINGPAIQSPYIGRTEETIRAIFAYAREYRAFHKHPLTVFFDEAEVLFPDRTGRTRRVMPWEESNVAQFLSEMDGLNSMGAFVILATNRPEAIDEALLRDGRCDRKIKVERPTKEAVEHIVRNALKAAPLAVDLEHLVMAAAESFFNPHYVLKHGHVISAMFNAAGDAEVTDEATNFCLEHIVSGAMVAGLARRAKSRAFARDKASGRRDGIKTEDVLAAVKEIFEENKTLDHAFALREFVDAIRVKHTQAGK